MQIAIEQSSSRSKGSMHSSVVVDQLPATRGGRFVRRPGDTHQAAHSILDDIAGLVMRIRSCLPKSCDRAHYQARINRVKLRKTEPQGLQRSYWPILDQYVSSMNKVAQQLLSPGFVQV